MKDHQSLAAVIIRAIESRRTEWFLQWQGRVKPELLMTKSIRVVFILASILAAAAAQAETWPSRLIKATIPFGAGSATDVVPRLVFDRLAAELGQPIVIENRAGAGGTLGTGAVAKADPDGYSILAHSSALTIAPAIFPNLTFDATKDLSSVLMIGSSANVMIVPTHVPYRGGSEVIADILGGRIDLYFCPLATALPLIREGQVRALVVSTPKRVAELPEVPTPVEIGLKDADSVIWFGVFAPAKTPRDIVEKLHAAGDKVLADPAMQASLKKLGIEPMPMKPGEMDDLVKRELAANLELIKAAG